MEQYISLLFIKRPYFYFLNSDDALVRNFKNFVLYALYISSVSIACLPVFALKLFKIKPDDICINKSTQV